MTDFHVNSHLAEMSEEVRRHHEAVLLRLGLHHWAEFDRSLVELLHTEQLKIHQQDNIYSLDGLVIRCPPGVYHANLNSSSGFILRHLVSLKLPKRPEILEVGVGSGAILLSLAKQYGDGRYVGVDISSLAIEAAQSNARSNSLDIELHQSDLFAAMEGQRFDLIIFNVPLYDKEPINEIERDMLCDPGGKTLQRFVDALGYHLKPGGVACVSASNIGQVAPLDSPGVSVSLQGAELFDTGVIRALVKITPDRG